MRQDVQVLQRPFEGRFFLQDGVGLGLVVPEVGCFDQAGEFREARFLGGSVKDASGGYRSLF
jgi:hypothetical protein